MHISPDNQPGLAQSYPKQRLRLATILTTGVIVAFAGTMLHSSRRGRAFDLHNQELGKACSVIEQSGAILPCIVEMGARSGDVTWRETYTEYCGVRAVALEMLSQFELGDRFLNYRDPSITQLGQSLARIDKRAFELAASGQLAEASALLEQEHYKDQQMTFAVGLESYVQAVRSQISLDIHADNRFSLFGSIALAIALPFLAAFWMSVIRALRIHSRTREEVLQKLTEQRVRAETASSAKSAFLADMSRQIRSPMNAIVGYSEILLDPHPRPKQLRSASEAIRHSTDQLLGLMKDWLDHSEQDSQLVDERTDGSPRQQHQVVAEGVPRQSDSAAHSTESLQGQSPLTAVPSITQARAESKADEEQQAQESTVDSSPATQFALYGRVLVAEDTLVNQRLVRFMLEQVGLEVNVADDGLKAVELVHKAIEDQRPIDVILMDLNMPCMDGYEATSLLRSENFPGAIIAFTASAQEKTRLRCLSQGFDSVLTKPMRRQTLLEAVSAFLKQVQT
ncbi:MAG: CheY-like chemotaxis protein [Planctomycetota bacterium]|jgi:CheY-like chemotaxis protein